MYPIPDIEQLRAAGHVPHYFGLGFIQVKLNERERLHFWVPEWPTIPGAENELHDHRYAFTSTALTGRLVHEIFALGAVQEKPFPQALELVHVTCQPGAAEEPAVQGFAKPLFLARFEVHAGGSYRLSPEAFHRARSFGPTITHVERDGKERDHARVLRPVDSAFTCPFSMEKSTEECWEQMQRIVQATPQGSAKRR